MGVTRTSVKSGTFRKKGRMIGQVISHYKILEKLGEGGMGVVYKAHDTKLDRDVALKFLPHYLTSDPTEKERFYHEARAAAALTHNNIAVVYEIGEHDGEIFIAMEYVEGQTLKEIIAKESLSIKKVLDIAIQVCEGLAAAYEKGIVHRDIKSDNIILTPKGQAKITDFGLAKLKGASKLTKTGSTLGTAAYMSPEQAQGEDVDHRSDIFSFGVVLYELLTGKLPFRGEHQAALLYSLVNEEPAQIARFNEKVTPELDRIVMKALAKDRDERYQHADDLLADLRRERKNLEYAKTGYIRTPLATQALPVVDKPKRKFTRYVIPAALIVAVVIAAIIFNPFNFQISTQKTVASEQNSLAVMYFQNIPDPNDKDHTGDMLTDLLITSLSQAKGLEVISRERLFDIQKELKSDSRSITPGMASEIAQRAGVTTMLLGSILQTEPQLAVTTRLIDVKTGRIINSQRVTGYSIKQIFPLVDTLALLVRNDLNVMAVASTPVKSVSEVTASSPEAYRSYTEGVELNKKYFTGEAKAAFERAIELDSNFAMAYFGLATLNLLSDKLERRTALEKAWQLRDKVTERERLEIEAVYTDDIGNDPQKAASIGETIVEKYPHEQAVYLGLGSAYLGAGDGEKAIQAIQRGLKNDSLDKTLWNLLAYVYAGRNKREEAFQCINRYLELAPGEPNPYDSKGELYVVFGELDSAVYWFRKAISFRSDFNSSVTLGHIALLRQDYAAAEKYYQQYGSTSDQSQRIDAEVSRLFIPLHRGQLNAVREQLAVKISIIKSQNLQVPLDGFYYGLTLVSGELGDYPAMLKYAQQLWQMWMQQPDAEISGRGILAWALAKSGNHPKATQTMEEFKKNIGISVVEQQATYDYTAALLAFEDGNFELAVEQFNKAFQHLFPNHAPQLLYAVSMLKTGHLPEAIRELQHITWWAPISFSPISLPSLPLSGKWPVASVKAHYWLGVAYEQQGKTDQAVNEYETFLNIWKDADFKSPEMQDARLRLAKLKGLSIK
jgi:serine/threonine protein kinase/Flp pilus assembly protein TadD